MENMMTSQIPVLSIRNLSKKLSGRQILHNICLDVGPGEIFGFLGPNGSGKTTTIKLMLGLLRIEEGEIFICGHNIASDFEAAVANIGGIIENPEMYSFLTGRQNLEQYARMYDEISPGRIDEVVNIVGLQGRIDDRISKYSLGMRQRLGVAQALLNHPKLLVLDEPTNGLDPAGIRDLRDILKDLSRKENVAVFVSSHLLSELELMCDRVGVIDRGKLLGMRSMEEMHHMGGEGYTTCEIVVLDAAAAEIVLAGLAADNNTAQDAPVGGETEEAGKTADAPAVMYGIAGAKITLTLKDEMLPEAIRALAVGGVGIRSVIPVKRTLEDAFLEMTRGSSTRKGGVGT